MDEPQACQEIVFGEQSYVVSNDAIPTKDNDNTVETKQEVNEPPQTEEEMRHCKHCGFQAEDWPTFAKHVFKPAHLRKLAEAYNIRLSIEPVSTNFNCDICAVECKGHQTWVGHLLGAKHRKALELLSVAKASEKNANTFQNKTGGPIKNNQFKDFRNTKPYDRVAKTAPQRSNNVPAIAAAEFAKYPEPLIGLEYVTEIQEAGQPPRYECCLCDTKFNHNLKFPHLVGQKHRTNVLKLRRPGCLKGLTQMKRSEITIILLRESAQFELEEGRSAVQTRTLDPPSSFNADYSQQNMAARGSTRGGRGKTWSTRGITGVGGSGRGNSGYKSNRGMSKPSRGFSMGQSAGSYMPSPSGPSRSSSFKYDSYNSFHDSYDNEPYGMASSSSFDNTTYGGGFTQSGEVYSGQPYSGSQFSGSHPYAVPSPKMPYPASEGIPPKEQDTAKTKEGISADLANALGDLTKLVQNEEDASVALHVSNALTQALLQYRIGKPEVKDH